MMSIISYPTLYSKDSSGRIRVWRMDLQLERYRTASGLQDGEKVTSEWTTVEAKNIGKANHKNPNQQAILEVEAKYKKQKKTGYFENVADIDNFQYVKPMLAKSLKDQKPIDFKVTPVLGQCKFNGTRCIATRYGLFTRKGEKYLSIPHIEDCLIDLFKVWPNAVLDGELYNFKLRAKLNELNSLVRKTKNITLEDLMKSEALVQYHVYDSYNLGSPETSAYTKRREEFIRAWPRPNNPYVKTVESTIINSDEKFQEFYQSQLDDGQEGIMIRFMDSPYEHKRSKYLLKVKPQEDDECKILDIREGSGLWAKTGKAINVIWEGKTFDITFKGSHEDATKFLIDKDKWIGKTVTFNYFGLTGLGVPQYCQFDYDNCLK